MHLRYEDVSQPGECMSDWRGTFLYFYVKSAQSYREERSWRSLILFDISGGPLQSRALQRDSREHVFLVCVFELD